MATALKRRGGGPKTVTGKLASSKNAIKHGLTAKNWLNEDEQNLYDDLLAAYTEDFKPKTNMELTMVAQLAECKTRLNRVHNAEDALFELAREQLDHPDHVVASFQTNNASLDEELNAMIYRSVIGSPKEIKANWDLNMELSRAHLSTVSGWSYVCENLPALRHHILDQCEQEQRDVATYLEHEAGDANVPVITFRWAGDDETVKPHKSRKELEETAGKVTAKHITDFIEKRLRLVTRDTALLGLVRDFDERRELMKKTALPETEKQTQINRYRTADQKLFSKTLAELIALQKLRREL